jgi:Tol biopolymer transport system component
MPSTACGGGAAIRTGPPGPSPVGATGVTARWAASDNWQIAINATGQPKLYLTFGGDFLPSWSENGSMLTYIHALYYGNSYDEWKTALCVIHADGTKPRALSTGQFTDFNPTWTRDGTNRIIFNRYALRGPASNDIYLISPQGPPGSEVLVSTPENGYEWAFSGLKDGRLFIDRIDWSSGHAIAKSFLLKPNPGGAPTYQEITRPIAATQVWQKLSVSPSETKVTYMLDNNVLYYADFDVYTAVVSNPVAITTYDSSQISEYPAWSADEAWIIYDSNRSGVYQAYAYNLAKRTTTVLSDNTAVNFQFADFEKLPK